MASQPAASPRSRASARPIPWTATTPRRVASATGASSSRWVAKASSRRNRNSSNRDAGGGTPPASPNRTSTRVHATRRGQPVHRRSESLSSVAGRYGIPARFFSQGERRLVVLSVAPWWCIVLGDESPLAQGVERAGKKDDHAKNASLPDRNAVGRVRTDVAVGAGPRHDDGCSGAERSLAADSHAGAGGYASGQLHGNGRGAGAVVFRGPGVRIRGATLRRHAWADRRVAAVRQKWWQRFAACSNCVPTRSRCRRHATRRLFAGRFARRYPRGRAHARGPLLRRRHAGTIADAEG